MIKILNKIKIFIVYKLFHYKKNEQILLLIILYY